MQVVFSALSKAFNFLVAYDSLSNLLVLVSASNISSEVETYQNIFLFNYLSMCIWSFHKCKLKIWLNMMTCNIHGCCYRLYQVCLFQYKVVIHITLLQFNYQLIYKVWNLVRSNSKTIKNQDISLYNNVTMTFT